MQLSCMQGAHGGKPSNVMSTRLVEPLAQYDLASHCCVQVMNYPVCFPRLVNSSILDDGSAIPTCHCDVVPLTGISSDQD